MIVNNNMRSNLQSLQGKNGVTRIITASRGSDYDLFSSEPSLAASLGFASAGSSEPLFFMYSS